MEGGSTHFPVEKNRDNVDTDSYRHLCLMSYIRKVVHAAIAAMISRQLPIMKRQPDFYCGISSTITLLDVDSTSKLKEIRRRLWTSPKTLKK